MTPLIYILVTAVLHGHIHSYHYAHGDGQDMLEEGKIYYRHMAQCQEDLAILLKAKPKKGVTVYMSCEEDNDVE